MDNISFFTSAFSVAHTVCKKRRKEPEENMMILFWWDSQRIKHVDHVSWTYGKGARKKSPKVWSYTAQLQPSPTPGNHNQKICFYPLDITSMWCGGNDGWIVIILSWNYFFWLRQIEIYAVSLTNYIVFTRRPICDTMMGASCAGTDLIQINYFENPIALLWDTFPSWSVACTIIKV